MNISDRTPQASSPERPLVTLALLTFNQERYVRDALESALAQTYSPLEIVVSDDNSSDKTFSIIEEISRQYNGIHKLAITQNKTNLGPAGNVNSCLEKANGTIICWAAGDDISLPGKIEALVEPMLNDLTIYGTHSLVNEIDEEGNFIRTRSTDKPTIIDSPDKVVSDGLQVISQSHAFRKEIFTRFGPLNPNLTDESCPMAFRESALGKIVLIEKPLTNYRIGCGVSTRKANSAREKRITYPIKSSQWWLTAYKQIMSDAKQVELSQDTRNKLEEKVRFYESLWEVNSRPFNIGPIFSSIFRGGFFKILKAFLRRNSPSVIYVAVRKSKNA